MNKILRVSVFILLILWMTLIFFLSNETATESSDTSGGFSYMIASVIYPDFDDLTEEEKLERIEEMSYPVRKTAHFAIFGIMGILSLFNVRFFVW
ncbi:MAG: VanZ family protein, partial [Clostridia bacterium]|nr:VanZ family protein [Clostridia bacterium]